MLNQKYGEQSKKYFLLIYRGFFLKKEIPQYTEPYPSFFFAIICASRQIVTPNNV